jgi:hypothetical protein
VGGSIRDAIYSDHFGIERKSNDLDFATTATGTQVMERVKHLGYSYPFGGGQIEGADGQSHQTIKLSIGHGPINIRQYDITTVTDIHTDLARRDLTINALALSMDGTLIDPFGGEEDIKNGVVRFNGDPATRIAEDPLRILRFIRFSHEFAKNPSDSLGLLPEFDPSSVTSTRLWNELSKAVLVANSDNFFHEIASYCLPWDAPASRWMLNNARKWTRHPEVLFCVAMDLHYSQVGKFKTLFKWTSLAAARARCVLRFMRTTHTLQSLKYEIAVHDHPPSWAIIGLRLRGDNEFANKIESWIIPEFPIEVREGISIEIRNQLKLEWGDSQFRLNEQQLLDRARQYAST